MPISWNSTIQDAVTQGYERYIATLNAAILNLAEQFVPMIESWMRENSQWEDRTGDARRLLHAEVTQLVSGAVISFGHGVTYGVYLEHSMAGRFSIVLPALDYWSVQIWAAIKDLDVSGIKQINTEALPYGASYQRGPLNS